MFKTFKITVKDLRMILESLPEDYLVAVQNDDFEFCTLGRVVTTKAKLYRGKLYPSDHTDGEPVTIVLLD